MIIAGSFGAAAAPDNPLACAPGRTGLIGPWYPVVRRLLEANRDAFPAGVDIPFLAAWIERESDGRHDAISSLGEVGYFQLHPAEIDDMFGRAQRDVTIASIRRDPVQSIRLGGALLRHYDDAIRPFGVADRGNLYHGLLKMMHTSRPRGIQWLRHVITALGGLPNDFNEFLAATVAIKNAQPGSVPPLPSCSAWQLLQRRDAFALPGDRGIDSTAATTFSNLAVWNTAAYQNQLGLVFGFPGVNFGKPLENVFVTGGWGRPRPERGGEHEGIDLRATVGTPVFAVEDGTVKSVSREEFAGLFVQIEHDAGWTSRYMHLDRALVQPFETVSRGDTIGLSGSSGIQRSAPHLHFDLLLKDEFLPLYVDAFGLPVGGFGKKRAQGTGVPAEPLIPADGYAAIVVRDAKQLRIPLHNPPFPWGAALLGIGGAALVYYGVTRRDKIARRLRRWRRSGR